MTEQPIIRENERRLTLDFECLESLRGGVNEVRVWWDSLLGCDRVGKRMDISGMEQDGVLPEPETLQSIRHDNIVPVMAAANVDGFPKPMQVIELITPYYPRGSVTDALLRGDVFSVSESVSIIQATLRGLRELHEVHGILHRDVKSGNVLLANDHSIAKLADLGLAGKLDDRGTTPAVNNPTLYSPPELVESGELTVASDLYPLGLILTELLNGNFPYNTYTTTEIADRLMKGQHPVKSIDRRLPIWTPRDLRRVIRKASERQPTKRYQSAREMDEALSRAKFADWKQTNEIRWEAPFKHYPNRAVSVEAIKKPRSGEFRLSLKVRRNAQWRREQEDVIVEDLCSSYAQNVFDQATLISCAR